MRIGEKFMNIDEIKNFTTINGWNEIVNIIPEAKPFIDKSSFGKKQGFDLLIMGYEAGIRAAFGGDPLSFAVKLKQLRKCESSDEMAPLLQEFANIADDAHEKVTRAELEYAPLENILLYIKEDAEARYALNLANSWYDSYLEDEALEAENSRELNDVLYADRF